MSADKQNDPRGDKEQLQKRLLKLLQEMDDKKLRNFLEWLLFDEQAVNATYFVAPGARSESRGHHAFKGGLAWHSITAAQLGLAIANHYESIGIDVNKNYVIAGLLLHDIGKSVSYEWVDGPEKAMYHGEEITLENEYKHADIGKKLHHIPIGFYMFMRAAEIWNVSFQDYQLSGDLIHDIGHIILAHHGRRSWSSPVTPQFLEAYIVHAVEMMDAYVDKFAKGQDVLSIYD